METRSKTRSKRLRENDNGKMVKLNINSGDDVEDWNDWVAATATRNYVLEDGILDVLKTKASVLTKTNVDYQNTFVKTIGNHNPNSFISSIMNQGNKFESKVINTLKKNVGKNNITNIGGDSNPRSREKYVNTIEAMKNGSPIIYQGVLRNYENKTYGIPDLLVRSDWLDKIVDEVPLSDKNIKIKAPNLCDQGTIQKKRKRTKRSRKNKYYHYVVIDIKFKTLHLKSNGINLRNDGPMKAYKSQLYVYNKALGVTQGYEPPNAYILGWKWKYVSKTVKYTGNNCFNRLGVIDYLNSDIDYVDITDKAVDWVNNVRKNSSSWDLSTLPLPYEQLYPNMCNRYDFPYHKLKRKFAQDIDEISLIWKCGPKQRRVAHTNGIYSWKDTSLTAEQLGIGGEYTTKIVDRILEANHSKCQTIFPKYITNNYGDWKNENTLELFVDFEMTCSVFSAFDDLPSGNDQSIIFMIGVGYIDPNTKDWVFKDFTVDRIDRNGEYKICSDFIEYINVLKYDFDCFETPKIYHWSHAEPSTWKRSSLYHDMEKWLNLNWVDLLKVFQSEPIGIKGCLNYGLKNVAKTFHNLGFIDTIWDTGSGCADGADAALGAYKVDKETRKYNTSFKDDPLAKEIIKYNEVDCKVLQEIIQYLRDHHIDCLDLDLDDVNIIDEFIYLCDECDLLYDTKDLCPCGNHLIKI